MQENNLSGLGTNNNLKIALQKMFEIVGAKYPDNDDYFKNTNWYENYTWTDKEQDEYVEWLVAFVSKGNNWHGILNRKPTKEMARKGANSFVFNYGWKCK